MQPNATSNGAIPSVASHAGKATATLDREVLDHSHAAKFLGVSARHLDSLVAKRLFSQIRLGRRRLYRKASLLAALAKLES